MRIELLKELEVGDFETAFFLTYTLSLCFFEELVLPRLRRMGVGRIGILVDGQGYRDSLEDPLGQSECGRAYVVGLARLPRSNLHHAKLLWLQSRDRIVAYIGSHNLTMAGYNDQLEVTARLESSDPGHVQALRDLHGAVSACIPKALISIWQHTSPPSARDVEPTAWALHNLERPLSEQLVTLVGQARELRVVTPFLDAGVLTRLVGHVGAEGVTLDVPSEGPDTPVAHAVDLVPQIVVRIPTDSHRLHAKAYEFRSDGDAWLALGSANCTQAALERTVPEGGNLEFLLVVRGVSLSDEAAFLAVPDPRLLDASGREWDADNHGSSGAAVIHDAVYLDGHLCLEWTLHTDLATCELSLGVQPEGRSFELDPRATQTTLDLTIPPVIVSLKTKIDGEERESRAWVSFPELLEAQVARRRSLGYADRIRGPDPLAQADHIANFLDQLIRDYLRTLEGESPAGEAASARVAAGGRSALPIREFVEIFTFSPDLDQVWKSAHELLSGQGSWDPLAILRSLIARQAAEPSAEIANDPDSCDRFERRREASRAKAGEIIARHLDQLAGADRTWMAAPKRDLVFCLRQTFGAVALLWHHAAERAASKQTRIHIAESFTSLLERLDGVDALRDVLRDSEVAGPLALSLGAARESGAGEPFLVEKLERLGRRLIGDDPRPVLAEWRERHVEQAEVLLSYARRDERSQGRDPFSHWEDAALRLFGIAPASATARLKERWVPLLKLQEADVGKSPGREDYFTEASAKYSEGGADPASQEIWRRYRTARSSGRLPIVFQTNKPSCPKCFTGLPENKARRLSLGDAVVCDSCHRILVLRG